MRGGYGTSGQGNLVSRTGADRRVDPPSPARHCFVEGQPSLLVEWRRGDAGWEGRVISVQWIDAVGWAARGQELGVGEILLNSIDADGTQAGFDLEMISAVRAVVTVPVIASGGAGDLRHFPPAVAAGADAVLAASVFHFGQLRIGDVKDSLRAAGVTVR